MVSQTAREDINQLIADGLKPSVDDIVRLNSLGLKLERHSCSAESLFYLPRVAWLRDIVLRQPTMGHEIWIDEVARVLDMADPMTSLAATAFACSKQDSDDLPSPYSKLNVVLALTKFKLAISKFTIQQIAAATRYVCDGNDAELYEDAIETSSTTDDAPSEDVSIPVGFIHDGMSVGLGISLADAKKMTRSQYQAIVRRYLVRHAMLDMKNDQQEASGDYFVTLGAIRARLTREKEQEDGN